MTRCKPEEPLDMEAAREKALSMLEYRAHTKKELVDKLQKLAGKNTAEAVAEQLEEVGLIDDQAYALQFAHDLMEARLPGPVKLRRELALRGIDDETAQYAIEMAEAEFGTDEERIRRLINIKYAKMLGDEKGRKRAADALFRSGYRYDTIKTAINEAVDGQLTEDEFTDGTD